MNMETNLIEQLNESADGYKKQLEVAKNLGKILPVAQWVTYGTILAAIVCIFSGDSCSISSLVDGIEHAHNKGILGTLFCLVCFLLNYLIPFVNFYIIHAIEVSLSTLKPEYQVSGTMTTFLKWGYIVLGVLNIIFGIADMGEDVALILGLFYIAFIIVQVIWARRLSQKWSNLSSWHKKTADLLRNYVYLGLGCMVVMIIAGEISEGAGDFVSYVIAGGIDLYLFYLFGTYYKEMANVCAYVKRNPNKTTTE